MFGFIAVFFGLISFKKGANFFGRRISLSPGFDARFRRISLSPGFDALFGCSNFGHQNHISEGSRSRPMM